MNPRKVRRYVLNEKGEPIPERSFTRWVKWCQESQHALIVCQDCIEGTASVYEVTTLFVCFDYAPEGQRPALFRTVIKSLSGIEEPTTTFPGCPTRHEAIVAHHDVIADLKRMQAELGR